MQQRRVGFSWYELIGSRAQLWNSLLCVCTLVLTTTSTLATPVGLSYLIDAAKAKSWNQVWLYLMIYATILIACQLSSSWFYYAANRLGWSLASIIEMRVAQEFLNAQSVSEDHVSYFIDRLENDLTEIAQAIYDFVAVGINNFFLLIGIIVVFFKLHALFASAILVICLFVIYWQIKMLSNYSSNWRIAKEERTYCQALLCCGLNDTAALMQAQHLSFFNTLINTAIKNWFKKEAWALSLSLRNWAVIYTITIVTCASGIWYLWQQSINGIITIGVLFMYIEYIRYLQKPIEELAGLTPKIHRIMSSCQRVFEYLDNQHEQMTTGLISVPDHPLTITLRSVSFAYSDENRFVVENFSAVFSAQHITVLMGPSGSGKSSILKILSGQLTNYSGSILINGTPITAVNWHPQSQHLGIIAQDILPSSLTLAESIQLYDETITPEVYQKAAAELHLTQLIERLPHGWHTSLKNNARQAPLLYLLAELIRLYLQNPQVLLIDEPTALISQQEEEAIIHALSILCKGRTAIIVSHSAAVKQLATSTIEITQFNPSFL